MSDEARPGIAEWSVDLPDGWFEVPLLGDGSSSDAEIEDAWIRDVVDAARSAAIAPGSSSALAEQLRHLRQSMLARDDPWLRAAVSVRPELELTIGCLLIGSQAALDADDDPAAFSAMLEDGFRHPGRGVRTHAWRTWRERLDAAEVVGSYQRFEVRSPGADGGTIQDRTFYGVFPDGASEMIRLEFSVSDVATFRDVVEETGDIVRTVTFSLDGTAD